MTIDRILAALGLIRASCISSALGDTSKRLERIAREALEESHELRKRLALEKRRAEFENEHSKNARAAAARASREIASLNSRLADERDANARLVACNGNLGRAAKASEERAARLHKALEDVTGVVITQSHNVIARAMSEIARKALEGDRRNELH